MIKVSIIIPTYNQEELIVRALDSIPDRDDIEVIVIDDCSTDKTLEVVKKYNKIKNLKIFHNDKNLGSGLSRNVGFDNAEGKWLYALDSDDYFLTDKFIEVINYLDKLDEYDIIHIYLECNNDVYWKFPGMCGFPTYFVKREFFGDTRCKAISHAEDKDVLNRLRLKYPREITISDPIFYHYNFPREGSISWNYEHGSGKW